jgi:hypothetical protein
MHWSPRYSVARAAACQGVVILDNLAAGESHEEIMRGYHIEREDIEAAIHYAAELARDMRELIRADQKRKVEERIDVLLLEGQDSGQPIPVTKEYWEEKKRRLTERLGKTITQQ